MNILVTGGQGFIGSHLVEDLLLHRHSVTLLDRVHKGDKRVRFILGDLKDRDAVFEAVNQTDAWINLAGLLGTAEMVGNPIPAVEVNVIGALNVFDAARLYKKPGVQIAVGNYWMNNPYSITKHAAERYAVLYNKEHGTDIRVVRAMNAYGPGQKHRPVRKIFPNLVVPAILGKPITIYGTGKQVMDLVHVDDVAQILRLVLEGPPTNEPYAVGMGGNLSVNAILEYVIKATGSPSPVKRVPMRAGEDLDAVVQASPEEIHRLYMDLGFKKFISLEEGIKDAAAWYLEHIAEFPWTE